MTLSRSSENARLGRVDDPEDGGDRLGWSPGGRGRVLGGERRRTGRLPEAISSTGEREGATRGDDAGDGGGGCHLRVVTFDSRENLQSPTERSVGAGQHYVRASLLCNGRR